MRDDVRSLPALPGTWVVMRRELRALLQDRRSVTMMVIFGLALPILIASTAVASKGKQEVVLAVLTEVLVFPYIAGLQAALTSFIGEREHGTLGPLLATPLSNISIFAGKLLGAAYLPGLATSIIGFVAFVVRLRGTSGDPFRVVHHDTLIEMIALSLVAGFAMVALGLLLGSKSKSVRGAQAITAVVVFPVIFGVQLLALVVVNHTALFAWSILIGIVVVIVLGLIFASRVWNREEALVSSG
ncbi:MAG TPA: ABC transporter permease subunit [Actinomycetota bacterium]|nr:ABC transporter permease subunit [Actinomycetota bacterium]